LKHSGSFDTKPPLPSVLIVDAHECVFYVNDLPWDPHPDRAGPSLWGLGSGVAGAAAILLRTSGTSALGAGPASVPMIGAVAVPVVSLLALVGPTGLTFPCWAVDTHSPGARLWRWVRARVPS
jgi:hypothetical protein